jgi:uncharacterized membrane protein YhaH (DUF805 family)
VDQVTACPKCQKKYRIAAQNVGKPMKCPACQTAFKAIAVPVPRQAMAPTGPAQPAPRSPAPVPHAGPAASPAEWKRLGLEGPLAPAPSLFPAGVPSGPDPLANHVVMDPGFAQVDIDAVRAARIAKEKKKLASDPTRTSSSLADMQEAEREMERKKKTSYLSAYNLFGFEGRISRRKFWLSSLFAGLVMIGVLVFFVTVVVGVCMVIDIKLPKAAEIRAGKASTGIVVTFAAIGAIIGVVSSWIQIALGVKRYHDLGHPGMRTLLTFIPVVGPFWVLYECGFIPGVEGGNEYGPDPLKEK